MKRTTQRLLLLAVFCFQLVGTHVRAGDPVNTQLEWIEDDSELIKLDWKTTAEWVIPPPSKKKKSPFPDHPYLQLSIEIPNHLNLSLNANEQQAVIRNDTNQILEVAMLTRKSTLRLVKKEVSGKKKTVGLTISLISSSPRVSVSSDCKREGVSVAAQNANSSALSAQVTCQKKSSSLIVTLDTDQSPDGEINSLQLPLDAEETDPPQTLVLTNRFDASDQVQYSVQLLPAEDRPVATRPVVSSVSPHVPSSTSVLTPAMIEKRKHAWMYSAALAGVRSSDSALAGPTSGVHGFFTAEKWIESAGTSIQLAAQLPFSDNAFWRFDAGMPIRLLGQSFGPAFLNFVPGVSLGYARVREQPALGGLYAGPHLALQSCVRGLNLNFQYTPLSSPGVSDLLPGWMLSTDVGFQVYRDRADRRWDLFFTASRYSLVDHSQNLRALELGIGIRAWLGDR